VPIIRAALAAHAQMATFADAGVEEPVSAFRLHLLRHGAPEVPGLLLGRTDAAPTGAGVAACGRAVADCRLSTSSAPIWPARA
jgi:hypothetical protein